MVLWAVCGSQMLMPEQDDDLFLSAASDGDVGLRANGTALADIDAYGQFQQIVNTLHRGLLNVGTLQYSDHSRSLTTRQGRSTSGDAHLVEQQFACGADSCGVGDDGMCADALCRRISKRRHGEHGAHHLAA